MTPSLQTDALIDRAVRYASRNANHDGLSVTPVPGLRMMCVTAPGGGLHSIYRPLVCFILQGGKRMVVGSRLHEVTCGQSIIVAADMPVVGRITEASLDMPYVAVAVELEAGVLRDLAADATEPLLAVGRSGGEVVFRDSDAATLDCARRLMELLDRPEAIPALAPLIRRELHYWLLAGRHGSRLRALSAPDSHASRLAAAIAILRQDFRQRIPVERLADASGMSLTAFHRHFKQMTALTPGQYQKRLRLIEARRLMRDEGRAAASAAFAVGYESASQFTREYARMFNVAPGRDVARPLRGADDATGLSAVG